MTVEQLGTLSMSSVPGGIVGSTEPRIWTPPLVDELTPATSFGFEFIEFHNEVLGEPLDPWEEWAVIHGGELLPDGRPRFRIVLIIVARQNGKTYLLVGLSLYWIFLVRVPLILGTSTKLEYAAESWKKAVRVAKRTPRLWREIPRKGGIRKTNGEQELWRADELERVLDEGSRYKIAAATDDAGRSLTIHRLILDELRQHHDYEAWSAATYAMNAVRDAQAWAITNMGSDKSVVLNDMRKAATAYIKTGAGDPRVGLFEWSCPPDANPLDLEALAMSNPNLGRDVPHGIDPEALLGDAITAVQKGGKALTTYKTEIMCIHVPKLDPAVDMAKWNAPPTDGGCLDPGSLDELRDRVAMCIEVSRDGLHATLYAAARLVDGRARVDPVMAWNGPAEMGLLARNLDEVVTELKPAVLGWFPSGPGASIATDLKSEREDGVVIEAIRGEATAVCMGLAKRIDAGAIAHSGDPLLDAHLEGAEKDWIGDRWQFGRQGAGHVDAAWAAAGAVHLALTLPEPPTYPKPKAV